MEFRIARTARDRYGLDEAIFSVRGDLVAGDPAAARRLARRVHEAGGTRPGRPVEAGDLIAMGLIHELSHAGIHRERQRAGSPGSLGMLLPALATALGPERLDRALAGLEHHFPATDVYRGDRSPAERLAGVRDGVPGREEALEETLLLWIANQNPAFLTYDELVADTPLAVDGDYPVLVGTLRRLLAERDGKPAGEDGTLVERLLAPIRFSPGSLSGQLRYILDHWGDWIDPALLARITIGLGILEEEAEARARIGAGAPDFSTGAGHGGPAAGFGALSPEYEAFSDDREWMPNLVLIAKSTYVWLDQLSRWYGREIRTLDAIPDEELDALARRGITGLWFIGLWERSPASARIKQMRGNPDAVASAYSLTDYRIAWDLGGEEAWQRLRDRAWQRGIRLASDMVPNHMGLDSDWVRDHPDRFLGRADPPYPSYTFNGPDLSSDPRVGIWLEDHYWDASDAAVVFKRVDRNTGDTRYLYHGNDGTSFPWNDTAQIDYLNPEAREAVIRTIIEVAKRFPIIRFDAAMVLARKHVQRLWYPLPGSGGAIPSRADAAVSQEEFERRMPAEFWREVVDRVAQEVPGTLLLAEAFWLLEGYFVRTLGMHRVYNSAFMHMLRDEDNAGYRSVIRETVSFDVRILGRYVNFMNNPDEKTAIEQFGDGDKYFGVASLLATLPGLPMVGHGQLEGFAEKYGMEYRRAKWDEQPRQDLLERHEREIVPLFRERWRFAGAEHFRLLDAHRGDGSVDEDVFAYANRAGDHRSLVVYRNKWADGRVTIPGAGPLLGADPSDDAWLILRDRRSGLDYLRNGRDLVQRGLELDLHAYQGHVFVDPQVVHDGAGGDWGRLAWRIGLAGVPDLHAALRDLRLEPLREAVAGVLRAELLRVLPDAVAVRGDTAADAIVDEAEGRVREALVHLAAVARTTGGHGHAHGDPATIAAVTAARLRALARGARAGDRPADRTSLTVIAAAALIAAIGAVAAGEHARSGGELLAAADAWGAARALDGAIHGAGLESAVAARAAAVARALVAVPARSLDAPAPADATGAPASTSAPAPAPIQALTPATAARPAASPTPAAPAPVRIPWLAEPAAAAAAGCNEWDGATWVDADRFAVLVVALGERDALDGDAAAPAAAARLLERVAAAGWRVVAGPPDEPAIGSIPGPAAPVTPTAS